MSNQKIKDGLIEKIRDKEQDLVFAKEAYLQKYGWFNSCSFPDCHWRWCKEVEGQTIAVSLGDALIIENEITEENDNGKS